MRDRIIDALSTIIALIVTTVVIIVFMLPGFVLGMWYGGHLHWLRVFVFAAGLVVGLLWMWTKWRRKYEIQGKLLQKALEFAEILSQEKLKSLMTTVEDFYEDSPITHHVLQLRSDAPPILRVGDDNHMVEVDWKCVAEEGIIVALERAKMEWQAEETNE